MKSDSPYKLLNHKRYKIRKLTSGNMTGDAYGITIPLNIALKYRQVPFNIYESGTGIILDMREQGAR